MLIFVKNSIEIQSNALILSLLYFITGLKHAVKLNPNLNHWVQYLVQYCIFYGKI